MISEGISEQLTLWELPEGTEDSSPPAVDGAPGVLPDSSGSSELTTRRTFSGPLLELVEKYREARLAQERDHTNEGLNFARSEAHDVLISQMSVEGIAFVDRDDAARIALKLRSAAEHKEMTDENVYALPSEEGTDATH